MTLAEKAESLRLCLIKTFTMLKKKQQKKLDLLFLRHDTALLCTAHTAQGLY